VTGSSTKNKKNKKDKKQKIKKTKNKNYIHLMDFFFEIVKMYLLHLILELPVVLGPIGFGEN
jgi:hypothetical protein